MRKTKNLDFQFIGHNSTKIAQSHISSITINQNLFKESQYVIKFQVFVSFFNVFQRFM